MYKYVVVVSCMYKNCVRSRQRDLLGQSRQMLSVFVCGLVGWLAIFLSFISSYLYCRVNVRFLKRRPILVYPGYQGFFLACVGKLRFVGRRPTRVRLKAGERHERRSREKKRAGSLFNTWPKPETAYEKPLGSGLKGKLNQADEDNRHIFIPLSYWKKVWPNHSSSDWHLFN